MSYNFLNHPFEKDYRPLCKRQARQFPDDACDAIAICKFNKKFFPFFIQRNTFYYCRVIFDSLGILYFPEPQLTCGQKSLIIYSNKTHPLVVVVSAYYLLTGKEAESKPEISEEDIINYLIYSGVTPEHIEFAK